MMDGWTDGSQIVDGWMDDSWGILSVRSLYVLMRKQTAECCPVFLLLYVLWTHLCVAALV